MAAGREEAGVPQDRDELRHPHQGQLSVIAVMCVSTVTLSTSTVLIVSITISRMDVLMN